ncbi:MAG: IS1634 family transposase [Propionibacteriaceae bacterium]|nr:IS1634 family transposase [Propionibacteriaceae bacterium]
MAPYVREVKTASGATAVQVVWSSSRGSKKMDHIGSAHTAEDLEVLRAAARQRLVAETQDELDFGDGRPRREALPIRSSAAQHLRDALTAGFTAVGFDRAVGNDEVFRQLVLARLIEPTSKLDSIRVLEEMGIRAPSYRTIERRLAVFAQPQWRRRLAAACAAHVNLGPATLVLYDVSTLYFETDTGDGFRESGYSKERRLEPQITIGLLTDARGFPLMVEAFEGNKAETTTLIPSIQSFMVAHRLPEVIVVCDAGMLSDANLKALTGAGLRFIVGQKIPQIPYVIDQWMNNHPGQVPDDQLVLAQPWARGPAGAQTQEMIYYQYRADRARRTLKGIDEQVRKAQAAIAGRAAVKRNRFIQLTGATKTLNTELKAKARTLAGWKGYITNLAHPTPEFVIGAYHQLWQIEKSFRMSKSDLKARPIYHRLRDSIEAHLSIVFAALAVARWVETTTGVTIKQLVKTLRRYRTIQIQAGDHIITAEDPLPSEVNTWLDAIHAR